MASSKAQLFFKVAITKLLRDVNIGRKKTKAKAKKQALSVVVYERCLSSAHGLRAIGRAIFEL